MDHYAIYTFGSGEIIEKVLNVLALLCQSDAIFLRPVLVLSASIGGLWAALNAMFGGNVGTFFKGWMLPTMLIFNLLFVPRVTVNVIDQVDIFHRNARVDNVPVGPALLAHVASSIAYHLTEEIEARLVPAEYANLTYGKSGPMFAAYLMASSRNLTVSDPILRENVKAYVDQCFTWPFLYTNISPGKEEALKSTNILDFMKTNAHPGLGMYWKDKTGKPTFMLCQRVPDLLNPAMRTESEKALSTLANQVLPNVSYRNPTEAHRAIAPAGESAWHALAKDSSSAHQRVEQQMVINAAREAIDDGLEKYGVQRRYQRLLSYSATRAEEQQNTGWLVMGLQAARHLPILQGVMLGLLLISFIFVCACTFLPNGLNLWKIWIQGIFWVNSWPIFYGIINCLGLLWLHKATTHIHFHAGEGISWMTQNGLADASWNAYCVVQSLFLSIPVLSWFFISGSSHALISMADKMMPTGGMALGQGIVDNTQSFDVQSFHNQTIGARQIAQQSLGAQYTLASSVDDGQFRTSTGAGGYQYVQEHMSNTRHAINANDAIQAQFSKQLGHEQQVMDNLSHSFGESKNVALDQSLELTKAFAQGKAHVQGATEAENRDMQKAAQEVLSANERYAKQHNVSESIAWSNGAGLSLSNIPIVGALLGGFDSSGKGNASKEDVHQFAKESGINKDISERMGHGLSAALNNGVSFTDESSKCLGDSFRSSINEAQNYSQQLSAQESKIDRLQEMGSFMESQGVNISQNLNDDVLEYVAAKNHWSKETAARWSSENPTRFREQASDYIQGWTQHMSSWLADKTGPLDSSSLDQNYQTYKSNVFQKKESLQERSSLVQRTAEQEGFGKERQIWAEQKMNDLYQNAQTYVRQDGLDFNKMQNKLGETEGTIADTHQAGKKEFDKFNDKSVIRRSAKVVWDKGVPDSLKGAFDNERKIAKDIWNKTPESIKKPLHEANDIAKEAWDKMFGSKRDRE